MFAYTIIADRLRTVSWSDYSSLTRVVYLVFSYLDIEFLYRIELTIWIIFLKIEIIILTMHIQHPMRNKVFTIFATNAGPFLGSGGIFSSFFSGMMNLN